MCTNNFFTDVWNSTMNVLVLFSGNGVWYKATLNKEKKNPTHSDFPTIFFNLTPVDVIQHILRYLDKSFEEITVINNLIPSANKFMKSHNLFNSKTKTEIQLRSTRSMQNCIHAYLSEYWHVTDNAIIVINETCKY